MRGNGQQARTSHTQAIDLSPEPLANTTANSCATSGYYVAVHARAAKITYAPVIVTFFMRRIDGNLLAFASPRIEHVETLSIY